MNVNLYIYKVITILKESLLHKFISHKHFQQYSLIIGDLYTYRTAVGELSVPASTTALQSVKQQTKTFHIARATMKIYKP